MTEPFPEAIVVAFRRTKDGDVIRRIVSPQITNGVLETPQQCLRRREPGAFFVRSYTLLEWLQKLINDLDERERLSHVDKETICPYCEQDNTTFLGGSMFCYDCDESYPERPDPETPKSEQV